MKIYFKYSNKTITIRPYNGKQEKEILLSLSLDEESSVDSILHILKDNVDVDISTLSKLEKIVLLYKLRSISIGEDIPIKFTCKCKMINEQVINVDSLVESSNIKNDIIIDQFTELNDDNFQDFISVDVSEMDLEQYDSLYEETSKSITKFKMLQTKKCYKCNEEIVFDISNEKFIIDNLSEDSLMSLYQNTADLVFFGHYTKKDVDEMIPFERSIFTGILNKTRESLN
jgi:hypothetical protein